MAECEWTLRCADRLAVDYARLCGYANMKAQAARLSHEPAACGLRRAHDSAEVKPRAPRASLLGARINSAFGPPSLTTSDNPPL